MAKEEIVPFKNETQILNSIEELEKLFDERISDYYQVKGVMHYRHNFVHYRSLLWKARNWVKKANVKEASDELIELGKFLHEREEDLRGEKMQTQPMHVYQYYGTVVDKIYNELHK